MKILLITDDYKRIDSVGGGDVSAQRIFSGLTELGHKVSVVCSWSRTHTLSDDCERTYRIFSPRKHWKSLGPIATFGTILIERIKLLFILKTIKPDVIYCLHQAGINIPIVQFINALSIPKVYRFGYEWPRLYYQTDRSPWHRYWAGNNTNQMLAFLARIFSIETDLGPLYVDYAIFNSKDLEKRIKANLSGRVKSYHIKNGIKIPDNSNVSKNNTSLFKLLYVGRIVKHKGLHVLIEAMNILNSKYNAPPHRLSIVGGHGASTGYYQEIINMINEYRISNLIDLVGPVQVEDIGEWYSSHDLLVFPSISRHDRITVEGCPSVLIEGLAYGLPIVARMAPGVDEVLTDQINCLGVNSDDPNEMAIAMLKVMTDQKLADQLSRRARKTVVYQYSRDIMIRKTLKVLMDAIRKN